MSDQVQLTDLDVITRYSIAVRAASADRDELLATLRADVAWLERGRPRSAPSYQQRQSQEPEYDEADYEDEPAPKRPPIRRMSVTPARRAPVKKTAAKKTTTAKKGTTKKATTRRTAR